VLLVNLQNLVTVTPYPRPGPECWGPDTASPPSYLPPSRTNWLLARTLTGRSARATVEDRSAPITQNLLLSPPDRFRPTSLLAHLLHLHRGREIILVPAPVNLRIYSGRVRTSFKVQIHPLTRMEGL
jgi:hypothetical protein